MVKTYFEDEVEINSFKNAVPPEEALSSPQFEKHFPAQEVCIWTLPAATEHRMTLCVLYSSHS